MTTRMALCRPVLRRWLLWLVVCVQLGLPVLHPLSHAHPAAEPTATTLLGAAEAPADSEPARLDGCVVCAHQVSPCIAPSCAAPLAALSPSRPPLQPGSRPAFHPRTAWLQPALRGPPAPFSAPA